MSMSDQITSDACQVKNMHAIFNKFNFSPMQFAKINAARARDLPSGLAMAWQSDLEDQYRIPHSTMQQIQTLNILLKIWLHGPWVAVLHLHIYKH